MPATANGATEILERDGHRAHLRSPLTQIKAGAGGQLVLIGGEAGTGKTALVRRFCAEHQRHVRLLWGACEALHVPRPLSPLLDIADATGGELLAMVRRGARPYELTSSLLSLLGTRQPAILMIEDAHWADEATLDLLRLLGRRIAGVRTLALVTHRDDELDGTHPLLLALGELATSVSALDSSAGDPDLARMAHHAEGAGEPALVLRFATAAAQRAAWLSAQKVSNSVDDRKFRTSLRACS